VRCPLQSPQNVLSVKDELYRRVSAQEHQGGTDDSAFSDSDDTGHGKVSLALEAKIVLG
jgi:hypothetical protein